MLVSDTESWVGTGRHGSTGVMNIGGFSDAVFNVISAFLTDNNQRFTH